MTAPALTQPTANTSVVSLRARSSADLIQAIHSPGDEAYVLERARVCLKAFFEPGMDDQDRAALLDEFARALRNVPRWAVARGFDTWMRTRTRRPSPAEINIEAQAAIRELTDELAHRKRMAAPGEPQAPRVDAETAERTLQRYGFTPKRMEAVRKAPMARTMDEALSRAEAPPRPHWTETADPDGPEMRALRAARDANPIVREARAQQRKSLRGSSWGDESSDDGTAA